MSPSCRPASPEPLGAVLSLWPLTVTRISLPTGQTSQKHSATPAVVGLRGPCPSHMQTPLQLTLVPGSPNMTELCVIRTMASCSGLHQPQSHLSPTAPSSLAFASAVPSLCLVQWDLRLCMTASLRSFRSPSQGSCPSVMLGLKLPPSHMLSWLFTSRYLFIGLLLRSVSSHWPLSSLKAELVAPRMSSVRRGTPTTRTNVRRSLSSLCQYLGQVHTQSAEQATPGAEVVATE